VRRYTEIARNRTLRGLSENKGGSSKGWSDRRGQEKLEAETGTQGFDAENFLDEPEAAYA